MRASGSFVKNIRRRLSNAKTDDATTLSQEPSKEDSPRDLTRDIPPLKSATNPQKKLELFKLKLEFCSELASFTSPDPSEKAFVANKRKALMDLVDFLNQGPARTKQDVLTEDMLIDLVSMIKANLFLALPPQLVEYDPEEDEPWLDASWPHKQVVYELLLRLVVSNELPAKAGKRQGLIDQEFCVCLIGLFESDDPRERDYLKTILHRVYGKFMTHRGFIRKQISFVFADLLLHGKRRNGIAELLEILGSIINGFALPLKPEHIEFIENSLILLHKSPWLQGFTSQLTYCVTQYIEKDVTTGKLVVDALVHYWPWGNSGKQVIFLNELEEVLELMNVDVLEQCAAKLFQCLAKCIRSEHFQVCERTLFLWNNENIVSLFHMEGRESFMRHNFQNIHTALVRNVDAADPHWNAAVTMLSYNVIDIYKERYNISPEIFNKKPTEEKESAAVRKRLELWEDLEKRFNKGEHNR